MTDLMDLYQELILDHNRRPRHRGSLETPDRMAEGFNPLCGDRVAIQLHVRDGKITDVRFDGVGCAISTAAASLMSEAIIGRTVDEAKKLFDRFRALVTGEAGASAADAPPLGKLEAFAGVGRFPARVKCATLPWHTLVTALDGGDEVVSTE